MIIDGYEIFFPWHPYSLCLVNTSGVLHVLQLCIVSMSSYCKLLHLYAYVCGNNKKDQSGIFSPDMRSGGNWHWLPVNHDKACLACWLAPPVLTQKYKISTMLDSCSLPEMLTLASLRAAPFIEVSCSSSNQSPDQYLVEGASVTTVVHCSWWLKAWLDDNALVNLGAVKVSSTQHLLREYV